MSVVVKFERKSRLSKRHYKG